MISLLDFWSNPSVKGGRRAGLPLLLGGEGRGEEAIFSHFQSTFGEDAIRRTMSFPAVTDRFPFGKVRNFGSVRAETPVWHFGKAACVRPSCSMKDGALRQWSERPGTQD